MKFDEDWRIRLEAFAAMGRLKDLHAGVVPSTVLDEGFEFEGERVAFWNPRRGIWRPARLRNPGAALSVMTAAPVRGREPAYDDEVAADDRGWFGYKYEGDDPSLWTNVAVRAAMTLGRPLIYLYGITPGVYEPLFPAYVVGDDPSSLTFRIQADVSPSVLSTEPSYLAMSAGRREYQTVAAKRRLHQSRFRELVLGAYRKRCSICRLGHTRLLDAAHIIPDHDDRGLPLISNGISLCKIHHSAYDTNIIGISPDLIVRVREDILKEIDGPMLEHGLKKMNGSRISVPTREELQPNKEFLAVRFEGFLAA